LITPPKKKILKLDNFDEKISQYLSKSVNIDDVITPPKEKILKLDNLKEKNEVVEQSEEIIEAKTSAIEIGQYVSKSANIDHLHTPPKTKILTKPDDFEEKNELVDQYETKRSDLNKKHEMISMLT